MHKVYITAENQLTDAFTLALDIFASGYRPDFVVGVWRGGCPTAIAIQEMLAWLGVKTDHIAIRSSSYTGIGERSREVQVYGLDYLQERVDQHHRLLLVDDVFDTGLSLQKIISELRRLCGDHAPDIRIATPWFKPANNRTRLQPDFHLHESADWLVFPHELAGLSLQEAISSKAELLPLAERLGNLLAQRRD